MNRPILHLWRGRATLTALAAGAALLLAPLTPAIAATGVTFGRAVTIKLPADTASPSRAQIETVGCSGPGTCAGGGFYATKQGGERLMVATQTAGKWSRAVTLQLPADFDPTGNADFNGIACFRAGSCVGVGDYSVSQPALGERPFLATEKKGKWSAAVRLTPPANAGSDGLGQLNAVTCTSADACAAIGNYLDNTGKQQLMAVSKPAGGHWRPPVKIKSPADASSTNPGAIGYGVGCASFGNCLLVGQYDNSANSSQALTAIESGGHWHQAAAVTLPANDSPAGQSQLDSVSCISTLGTCVGVGYYPVNGTTDLFRAMGVTEKKGKVGAASAITLLPATHDPNASAQLGGVSCGPAGPCVAVGYDSVAGNTATARYVTRAKGRWGAPSSLKLPAGVSSSLAALFDVSCTGAIHCTAGGTYGSASGAFVPMAASTG